MNLPFKRFLHRPDVIALITMSVGTLAAFGWVLWTAYDSYIDYDRVKTCLERHQFDVVDGWQHQDLSLEDFGWEFRTQGGKQVRLDIYDINLPRHCNHRAHGVRLLDEPYAGGPYLSFDHPELVRALGGKRLRTMDDMLENLDELLVWVDENPSFKEDPGALRKGRNVFFNRSLNLIVFPDQ